MGPLKGIKIVEMGGIGPGPFCAQMLSDMGAEVIRIDRKGGSDYLVEAKYSVLLRGRRSIAVDLKSTKGIEILLRLIRNADGLIEGYRPGVMERLGLGPEDCIKQNPKLVYGRMTGWGQKGPLAQAAGHDINYIALTGALNAMGEKNGKPLIPLNLVGDFGGGGLFLAFGLVCGLLEAKTSGKGQVVDAAMVDGASSLMGIFFGLKAAGLWKEERGSNILDGAAHFYNTYETSDKKWISVGSIEPQFYKILLKTAGIKDTEFNDQMDMQNWQTLKEKLAAVFKTKTRDEWCQLMENTDICFAPVLSMAEAKDHPHMKARNTIIDFNGFPQPAPAPRFSRTSPEIQGPPPEIGEHSEAILKDWGFNETEITDLKKDQVI
ncbi:CoA transferase [bacterium]|nr:CoA transferase [bacterium]